MYEDTIRKMQLLHPKRCKELSLCPSERIALKIMYTEVFLTAPELAQQTSMSTSSAANTLRRLEKMGYVFSQNVSRGRVSKEYFLNNEIAEHVT